MPCRGDDFGETQRSQTQGGIQPHTDAEEEKRLAVWDKEDDQKRHAEQYSETLRDIIVSLGGGGNQHQQSNHKQDKIEQSDSDGRKICEPPHHGEQRKEGHIARPDIFGVVQMLRHQAVNVGIPLQQLLVFDAVERLLLADDQLRTVLRPLHTVGLHHTAHRVVDHLILQQSEAQGHRA